MKSRFIVATLLLATLATATLATATLAHATEIIDRRTELPGTFPVIAAETLRGRSVRLPEQLKGERNLLIVAYEREQQADIDTWLAVLDTLAPQLPDFAYYELPTIGTNYKWMRAVIDGGMKQGIPDRAQRDRTITLYWMWTGSAGRSGRRTTRASRRCSSISRGTSRRDGTGGMRRRSGMSCGRRWRRLRQRNPDRKPLAPAQVSHIRAPAFIHQCNA
jgi:hypothetical protein